MAGESPRQNEKNVATVLLAALIIMILVDLVASESTLLDDIKTGKNVSPILTLLFAVMLLLPPETIWKRILGWIVMLAASVMLGASLSSIL